MQVANKGPASASALELSYEVLEGQEDGGELAINLLLPENSVGFVIGAAPDPPARMLV